jgi:hypothetical protein
MWQRLERMRESPHRVSAAWAMIVVADLSRLSRDYADAPETTVHG